MIKKFILVMLLSILLISCGKKGCPKIDQKECNELFDQNS